MADDEDSIAAKAAHYRARVRERANDSGLKEWVERTIVCAVEDGAIVVHPETGLPHAPTPPVPDHGRDDAWRARARRADDLALLLTMPDGVSVAVEALGIGDMEQPILDAMMAHHLVSILAPLATARPVPAKVHEQAKPYLAAAMLGIDHYGYTWLAELENSLFLAGKASGVRACEWQKPADAVPGILAFVKDPHAPAQLRDPSPARLRAAVKLMTSLWHAERGHYRIKRNTTTPGKGWKTTKGAAIAFASALGVAFLPGASEAKRRLTRRKPDPR